MSVFHQNILAGASGAGGAAEATYVDDVFSTFLYEGNSSTRTITNNIDLSGEGGLVWIRTRAAGTSRFVDTERGATKRLSCNNNNAEGTDSAGLTSFTSTGFTLGSGGDYNDSNDYVSWSFRKAPGFFDVVTYTGNGTAGRTVSHSLGSTPGAMIIKKVNNAENWIVYHRSVGATQFLKLNENVAAATSSVIFNNTAPTSTEFTLGLNSQVNENGDTYVAYVFAHDDQSFGTDEDEAIIKCGQYTGNGASDGPEIDLGFEPQWVMIKARDEGGNFRNWAMFDNMRGVATGEADKILSANLTTAEDSGQNSASTNFIDFTPTGFKLSDSGMNVTDKASQRYIYIAIRRPHKPPTDADDVFAVSAAAGDSDITTNFPVDLAFQLRRSAGSRAALTRLQGKATLETRNNSAESVNANAWYESNTKFLNAGLFTANSVFHLFKRAPGFCDVVTYTGTGSNSSNSGQQNITHNLGAVPELIIVKVRDTTNDWVVYNSASGAGNNMRLNRTNANISDIYAWDNTTPTSSVFRVGADLSAPTNSNTKTFVAYLFATLAGISKVGSYSGTGSDVDVDCGFSAGARFVLIKRTDSTGDWYVWDTARGIVTGNDPYLELNTGDAEVTNTDYIDPLNSGFTVTSSAPAALNASGGTYLFLAIA